ncbi:MAG: inositol monophosphatase family protein [Gammaproteobacteria bacterium]|nr:inositol monophosphatase family protein [Gammaproteobacteria bacterium]
MQALLNTAIEAARKAGDIIIRGSSQIDRIKVESKARNEFVTQIDQSAEAAIIELVQQRYPDHAFLGEESGVSGKKDADHVWIIDPIDGTTNFIHGYPQYCVSIGVKVKGRLAVGVVYDPISQELFSATRGSGATLDGRRIRVSNRRDLDGALVATEFPFRSNAAWLETNLNIYRDVMTQAGGIRHPGSAALSLCYLAAGRLDAAWMISLKPWDIAAGVVILRESGGLVSSIADDGDYMESGNLVAGSPKVHNELKGIIDKHL